MIKNIPTKNLLDAFPDCFDGKGIFSEMENMPWSEEVDADLLDLDYFGNHSGWKKCSPIVYKLFGDTYTLSDASREKLADLVVAKFGPNWAALWASYHQQYNPIENYSLHEVGDSSEDTSRSKTFTRDRDETDTTNMDTKFGKTTTNVTDATTADNTETRYGKTDTTTTAANTEEDVELTHGEVVDTESDTTTTEQLSKWGFNSSTDPVPTDARDSTVHNEGTTTHSGTDVTDRDVAFSETKSEALGGRDNMDRDIDFDETRTETLGGKDTVEGSYTEAEDIEDAEDESGNRQTEHEKTTTGLNGLTTRQDLILKERALWENSFFDKVFSDIDSVLTTLIYKREHRVSPYYMYPFGYYSI